MINKLKNWWFVLLTFALLILDQGFDVLNPFLIQINVPEKWIGAVKLVFGFYGVYKLKKSLPTQNVDKLQEIVNDKKNL
jgi:hypothetical protein